VSAVVWQACSADCARDGSKKHAHCRLVTDCGAGMDRFLDEEDIGRQDFVRKEYALALKLKKNFVPVKHEDFVFPEKSRVPADVQPVVGMNAIPWISAYREASFERLKNALM
jgi:hypothetical protein